MACLIGLAKSKDIAKQPLETKNNHKETILHEVVFIGNNYIVNLLMEELSNRGRAATLPSSYD